VSLKDDKQQNRREVQFGLGSAGNRRPYADQTALTGLKRLDFGAG
jgi:hypothetical protein